MTSAVERAVHASLATLQLVAALGALTATACRTPTRTDAPPIARRASAPVAEPAAPIDHLGLPCADGPYHGTAPAIYICGTDGRVAAMYVMHERGARGATPRDPDTWIAVGSEVRWKGDVLWLSVTPCPRCEVLFMWDFIGIPSKLRDERLTQLQRNAGLQTRAPHRTREQWAEAVQGPRAAVARPDWSPSALPSPLDPATWEKLRSGPELALLEVVSRCDEDSALGGVHLGLRPIERYLGDATTLAGLGGHGSHAGADLHPGALVLGAVAPIGTQSVTLGMRGGYAGNCGLVDAPAQAGDGVVTAWIRVRDAAQARALAAFVSLPAP